ncbi:hypothetical protein HY488_03305 [Candidatus Woesearchaeota archaeon]|nr:hypothetical protein [Candidatus Woesearchaeota archaeon]
MKAEGKEKQEPERNHKHICAVCGIAMKKTKGGEYNAKCMSCGYEVACCDVD